MDDRRIENLECKDRDHSNEIHLIREWISTANVHLERIPALKKDVESIKDNISTMTVNGVVDSLHIKQIQSTMKWALGVFTALAIAVAGAYIKTRM